MLWSTFTVIYFFLYSPGVVVQVAAGVVSGIRTDRFLKLFWRNNSETN